MKTYEAAHSTLGVEFPLFYEGFDQPVAKLQRISSGQYPKCFWEYRSHRNADSVDAQILQTLNIGLGEPGLPMLIEDLVSGVRVGLGELAVELFEPWVVDCWE
jgi:hypothetical protein